MNSNHKIRFFISVISLILILSVYMGMVLPYSKADIYAKRNISSCSMSHFTGFDEWWEGRKDHYSGFEITKEDFLDFPMLDGIDGAVTIPFRVLPKRVDVGDVIAFNRDGKLISHRVVKKYVKDSGIVFVTLGDNNDMEDAAITEDEYVVKLFTLYDSKKRQECASLEDEECRVQCHIGSKKECSSLTGRDKEVCMFLLRECSLIENQTLKDRCFYWLGSEEDILFCNAITDEQDRNGCYRNNLVVYHKVGGVSDCDPVTNESWKSRCYYHAALKFNDPLSCFNVHEQRDECFYYTAISNDNISICSNIMNISMNEDCEDRTVSYETTLKKSKEIAGDKDKLNVFNHSENLTPEEIAKKTGINTTLAFGIIKQFKDDKLIKCDELCRRTRLGNRVLADVYRILRQIQINKESDEACVKC